jgi:integrase
MPGKQAKILSAEHIDDLLLFAETTRHPLRNRVIVLLSAKAGLRAAEIANLTWDMVRDPDGSIGSLIELRDSAAKMGHGRRIPIHPDLRIALVELNCGRGCKGPVVASVRGGRRRRGLAITSDSRCSRSEDMGPTNYLGNMLRD